MGRQHRRNVVFGPELLERRELLDANLVLSDLCLAPPLSEPLSTGEVALFQVTARNTGDTAAPAQVGEIDVTRYGGNRPDHVASFTVPALAPGASETIDIGAPGAAAWEVDRNGLFIAQATIPPEGPKGDPRNDDNSAGLAVQVGIPDFEVSLAPRIVYTSYLAGRIPKSRQALGDMTLQGISSRLEIEVRNNGEGPVQSYVEVSVTRLGEETPEWVGAVVFDLATGQTLRTVAKNTDKNDAFPTYWSPKYAGIYIVSAVADPPTAGQPRGAILESNDTNGDDPDPDIHFGNNAKFTAVHVHAKVPSRRGSDQSWLRAMVTADQDGGPGGLVTSYFVADHTTSPCFADLGERDLATLVDDHEWTASSYDNALAVIYYASRKDRASARSILAEMAYLQDEDGGLAFAWHAPRPKLFAADPTRRAGNVAWVILAVDWYTAQFGDTQFLPMARKAADWLLTLKNPDGSVRGGDDVTWVSNEHNLDAMSALRSLARLLGPTEGAVYTQAAEAIQGYLQEQAWIDEEGRFRRGAGDDYAVADVQTWGVMALGPWGPDGEDYTAALTWLEEHGRYTDTLYPKTVTGVDFNAVVPDTVSSEQTAIYATALGCVRDLDPAFASRYSYYVKQLTGLQNPDGGVRYSSRPGDIDEIPEKRSITLESVAGTVWTAFAKKRLNPYDVPQAKGRWSARVNSEIPDNKILEIGYGSGTDFPQVAAFHLDGGFLRLNYGADSGWGTSVILPPSFWSGGVYYQGADVKVKWRNAGSDLLIAFSGSIGGLRFSGTVRLSPPNGDRDLVTAQVTMEVKGNVVLDPRPGEAFKPVALSSMRLDDDNWDAHHALIDGQAVSIPSSGWIEEPPVAGRVFGLAGGTSKWKTNAPSVNVVLKSPLAITGWVTSSSDPNDDNLSLWAASDTLVRSYAYDLLVRKGLEGVLTA